MNILEKLREQGWYLTEEAIKKLPEDVDKSDSRKIIQAVMDTDLRGIAEGALPLDISKKIDSIPGRRVLQIVKIRNISAPKANEESKVAPRFLQLELTDGANQVFALEFENISSISLNTPPGTKIYLRTERISLVQGQLMLRSNDIQVLGGKVNSLIEKWEMARTLQKYTKSDHRIMSGSTGPPPWIAFGQKIELNIAGGNDKNFKSLGGNSGSGDKENKEKNEFDTMRSEAIAEATKAGAKKVFGGGNQQLLDHNVKKIMEKGFTEEEARNALKANRNILEQALYTLKRRDEFKNKEMVNRRGGFKDTKKSKSEEPIVSTKPAANVSLFDFMADKLPASSDVNDKNTSVKPERTKSLNPETSNKSTSSYHSQQQQKHQQSYSHHQTSNPHYQSTNSNQQQQQSHQQKRDQHSQQSSQYQQQQQQNAHASYNHINRPKFENNLSSSFANRNSSAISSSDHQSHQIQHQQQQQHDNYKNKNSREDNAHNSNNYMSRQQKESSTDNKYRNNQRNNNYNQNQRQNQNERYSTYQKGSVSQQQSQQQQQQQQQHHQQQHGQQEHQQQQTHYQPSKTSNSSNYDPRNRNEYQKRNGYDNMAKTSSSSSRYHSKETPSHQSNARNFNENRQSSNVNESAKMNKLVEDTSKMKIDSSSSSRMQQAPRSQSTTVATTHHQVRSYQQPAAAAPPPPPPAQQTSHLQQRPTPHSQQQHQTMQQQQSQQHQQPQHNHNIPPPPHTTYAQLPNGFTYDPSKIMGFQSKEANEFAMNLLKSQTVNAPLSSIPVTPHGSYPPPLQIPPPAFPTPQYVMQQPAAPPPHAATYGMGQCGDSWNWKIGDRCLAKYWDDGRYYDAEVTGVSDKTCVVLYLGYGNHEEVLKSDCLPITDAQHRPINVSKLHETHPSSVPMSNPAMPPPSMVSQGVPSQTVPGQLPTAVSQHQHAMNRGMHSGRYRGERQMYVPPPKRDG